MLVDGFNRMITYMRISVTDRCNYRCSYCMPEDGVELKSHNEMLSYEQIVRIAEEGVKLGIRKIRLTGGEPLVRKRIESLVASLASIPRIEDLAMTTNGALLTDEKAAALKEAGLMRINISLDTLDPDEFRKITRCGRVEDTLAGIEAARRAGFGKIKVNMVVFEDTPDESVKRMSEFCNGKGLVLQTINHFSLHARTDNEHTDRPPKCFKCNRIRLTADGYLLPCLYSDTSVKVDMNKIAEGLIATVNGKPRNGVSCSKRQMYQIGG